MTHFSGGGVRFDTLLELWTTRYNLLRDTFWQQSTVHLDRSAPQLPHLHNVYSSTVLYWERSPPSIHLFCVPVSFVCSIHLFCISCTQSPNAFVPFWHTPTQPPFPRTNNDKKKNEKQRINAYWSRVRPSSEVVLEVVLTRRSFSSTHLHFGSTGSGNVFGNLAHVDPAHQVHLTRVNLNRQFIIIFPVNFHSQNKNATYKTLVSRPPGLNISTQTSSMIQLIKWLSITLRISARAFSSGAGNSIFLPIRPGLNSAGSRMSIRLVAIITCKGGRIRLYSRLLVYQVYYRDTSTTLNELIPLAKSTCKLYKTTDNPYLNILGGLETIKLVEELEHGSLHFRVSARRALHSGKVTINKK